MSGISQIVETYVTAETLDAELAGWMEQIQPFQWRPVEPLAAQSAALLVVDMTRPFVEPGGPLSSPNARAIVGRLGGLVGAFRRANRPVLWIVQGHHSVQHDRGRRLSAWWPTAVLEGTRDVEMAEGLDPAGGEKVIIKRRYSGFHQTDLECTLRCLEVAQVVIAGVLTHVCPYATAVDAFSRDFAVYYPADCTASLNRSLHVGALQTVAGWLGHVVESRWLIAQLG